MPTTTLPVAESMGLPAIESDLRIALEADILDRGIICPVIVTEDGEALDGKIRLEIASKHGLACPKVIVAKLSKGERTDLRIKLNVLRRHLTREQRRELLAWEIRRRPEASDRSIAGRVGVSPSTVGKVRSGVQVGQVPNRIGADGKRYPSNPKPIITTQTEAEAVKASRILGDLDEVPDRRMTLGKLRTLQGEQQRRDEASGPLAKTPANISINKADFRRFDWKPWTGKVSLILVDPPWGQEFAPLRKPLIELCNRLLRPGGVLALYTGQASLPEWLQSLGPLQYKWTIASVNEQSPTRLFNGKSRTPIYNGWRPIVVASKGELKTNHIFHDVLRHDRQKDHHEWQQPAEEARRLIETFSRDGEIVVDPCCGSGSSLVGVVMTGGGRIGVGVDIDGDAVRIAKKRIAEVSA